MSNIRFRCSSIGKLMTAPKLKSEVLSVGAKTYIRSLAAQEIFGVDFEVSSKQMEKGQLVEGKSIDLLNRVRGLSLAKNAERRTDDFISGECDLFDAARRRGHDIKSSWSLASFPITEVDCEDSLYEWQMRGYMRLWDAEEWEVNYAMVDTPDNLIGYEPLSMHLVSHIPEHMRLTTWRVRRDLAKEAEMVEKIKHARLYFAWVIEDFDLSHRIGSDPLPLDTPATPVTPQASAPARAALPENIF